MKTGIPKALDVMKVLAMFEMYPLSPATMYIVCASLTDDNAVLQCLHSAIPRVLNADREQFEAEVMAVLTFMKNNGGDLYAKMRLRILNDFGLILDK